MDFKVVAREIYELIGGKSNLVSAAHCATRLRLVIANNDKCDSKAIEAVDGVKGVFNASGQLQIIFGTGVVNKVYAEFITVAGISESTKEEAREAAAKKGNFFQRLIKTVGDIFVPIIPAIVASGLLMGLMEAMNFMVNEGFLNIDTSGSIYQFAILFSNVAYTFLPILIAFSSAKVFGANPYLGAVIGMIMIHPSLQNAWTVATEGVLQTQPVFFGLYEIEMVGYQGHVIPIIIAVWVLSVIEKRLHKVVPSILDLFVTPLVSVFVTGYLTLAVIGPVFVLIENSLLGGIQWLIALPLGIGSFIMGGAYATTVVSGIHHMYTVIDVGQLSQYGLTYWLSLASAANVAQGAAALGVAVKTKNKKLKSLAFPASLSAFMGITEPAIFGVNLRYMRPFIAGSIGGACGALYASIVGLGATGTGVTGIFGILLHLNMPLQYIIAMLIAAGVAFAVSWVLGIKEEEEPTPAVAASGEAASSDDAKPVLSQAATIVYSALSGDAVALSEIDDQTFAQGLLGEGVAILPNDNQVYAPFDGEIVVVTNEKHAIGLKSEGEIEILIHVGMDKVTLKGEPFTLHCKAGDKVKQGDLLLEFDTDMIKKAGLPTVTPIVVTSTDYTIKQLAMGRIQAGTPLLSVE